MTIIYTATADVENGSTTVEINTGDPLSAAIASPGFLVAIDGIVYFIENYNYDTLTFELTREYAGSTDTDVPLEIWPINQATSDTAAGWLSVRELRDLYRTYDKNAQGLFFNVIGVTGAADPGPGNIALNNADPEQATEMYVDYLDANTNHRNIAPIISRLNPGDTIRLRSLATTAFYEFQLSGIADSSGYFTFGLTHIASDGVIGSEPVALSWILSGNGLNYDAAGTFAGRDAYDDEWLNADGKPFAYLSSDGDGDELTGTVLFIKASAASGDWLDGFPLTGPQGDRGWSPVLSIVDRNGGAEAVFRLIDWVGGQGTKPTAGVNQYIMPGGFTSNINLAYNVKGLKGDPQGVRLQMVTSTGTTAMTAGQFRTNNATFGSVTLLRFNAAGQDLGEGSITGWLGGLDDADNAVSRGTLRFQSVADPLVYMEFDVTGDLTVGTNDNYELPVSPRSGSRPGSQTTFAAHFVPAGADGRGAYQIAVDDGFEGTEQEWLASLNGADGTDPGVMLEFSENTDPDVDEGSGTIWFDASDLTEATVMCVSKLDKNGDDISNFLALFNRSTNPTKGTATVARSGANGRAVFNVTGVTDATTYVKVALAEASHSGTDGFVDEAVLSLQFNADGNAGSTTASSLAAAINDAPEVVTPNLAAKLAMTDPDASDTLAWVTPESLGAIFAPKQPVDVKTGTYTVVEEDNGKLLAIDATSAARTVNLLAAATAGNGFRVSIKKADASTNAVTIDGNGSETIDGLTTFILRYRNKAVNLISDGSNWLVMADSSLEQEFIHVQDQKSNGTNGGTFTQGAWQTRDLNTVLINTIFGASLSSNQISLPAGVYRFDGSAPAHTAGSGIGNHKARLINVTESSVIQIGTKERLLAGTAGVATTNRSFVAGWFVIASPAILELQHMCEVTQSNHGFGNGGGVGGNEVYSDLKIWKVA